VAEEHERIAHDPVADWTARAALVRARAAAAAAAQRIVFVHSDVYINGLTGDDDDDGLSPSTAWKTNAALDKAIGVYGVLAPSGTLARWFTVHYAGAVPSDLLNLQAVLAPNVCFRALNDGISTVLRTGTITAAVAYSDSNVLASITDPGVVTWAPFMNKRITWTSGAANGAQNVIAANVGGGVARIGNPGKLSDVVATGETFPTFVAPSTGTYVVESLPVLQLGHFDIQSTNNGNRIEPFINFVGFDMGATGPVGADPQPTGTTIDFVLQGCSCEWQAVYGINLIACLSVFPNGLELANGTSFDAVGCVFNQFCVYNQNATGAVSGFTLFEGCGVSSLANASLDVQDSAYEGAVPLGFANVHGDAITTVSADYPAGRISLGAAAGIVGSGNAGVGVRTPLGDSIVCRGVLPKVTGTGGDLAAGLATTAYAWDDTAGAFVTPKRACTWALVATSVAGGGFGGQVFDVRHESAFIGPDV
jgi:hypothetical protein